MSRIDQKPCRVFIVPETHWDRAWYLPFELFRRKLVELFDRLIAILERDPDFTCFVADGQTVVIEDYLQIRPERRATLEKLIQARRLRIGPWYVLPDEFIVGGESLVRNLAIGTRMAQDLGGAMSVGYVPDPFGHVGQLPQILRGFGIDNFIFSRGVIREKTDVEFNWKAPDGSTVLALFQRNFYINASFLGYPIHWGQIERMRLSVPDALAQIERTVEELAPVSRSNSFLLNNGVDHSQAQPELPRIVESARRRWPSADIRIAGFDDYVRAVQRDLRGRRLPVRSGELTYPHGDLLRGVYSARVYLKQANHLCETLLCHYAEPLDALAMRVDPRRTDEAALLDYAWRKLIKNHPHDDICGCSVDRVHRDMVNRFERVEEIARTIAADALRDAANQMDHTARQGIPMVLYNPTGRPRRGARDMRLLFERGETDYIAGRFRLVDARGRAAAFEIAGGGPLSWMEYAKRFDMHAVDIVVDPGDLPAMGFKTLYAEPLPAGRAIKPIQPKVRAGARNIENEHLRVRVAANGTYRLTDKHTGRNFDGLGVFEDVEDCGDEYSWSDVEKTDVRTSKRSKADIKVVQHGPLHATLRIKLRLAVPASLRDDREARSKRTVTLPITTELTLRAGARRLDVRTTVDNRASDHRLRVLFPTGIDAETVQAGGHFDTVERLADLTRHPHYEPTPERLLYPTEHFAGFVRVGDRRAGLAVLAKGLCEYESIPAKKGVTLALTLFRSVGWLSPPKEFRRRRGGAGPPIESPEAQMLGMHVFEYALYPHRGDWTQAGLTHEAQELAQPVLCERGDRHGTSIVEGHESRTRPIPREGVLPDTFSLATVKPAELVVTAIRRGARKGEWILRLHNPTPQAVRGAIEFPWPARSVRLCDLAERPLRGKPLGKGERVTLRVGAKKIVTLAVRFLSNQ